MTMDPVPPLQSLHTGFSIRPPRDGDVPAVTALVATYDTVLHGAPDISEEDIRDDWNWPGLDPARDIWLLYAPDGTLVGYARLAILGAARPARIDLTVHPAEVRYEGALALLSVAEKRRIETTEGREPQHPSEAQAAISVSCPDADTEMRRALDGAGYRLVRTFFRMEIELAAGHPQSERPTATAFPSVPLPGRVEIRAFRPGEDDRAIHAVIEESFAEHFEFSAKPFDVWWSQRTKHERFDPALWLMAWDGDRVAGALTAYDFVDIGFVSQLGVLKAYRGCGIATALLLESFERIRLRGLPRAVLGVDSENHTGAIGLYERLGMRVTQRHDLMQKRLR